MSELQQLADNFKKHTDKDEAFQASQTEFNVEQAKTNEKVERIERVLFGDEDEIGMKKKVDAMYVILIQSRGLLGFVGGTRGLLLLVLTIGGVIALIKGWFLPKV